MREGGKGAEVGVENIKFRMWERRERKKHISQYPTVQRSVTYDVFRFQIAVYDVHTRRREEF
jgi:hypothetical protein